MQAVTPHPARGPRGVQVRPGRHAGEEQRPLAGLRDGVRGLLLAAGAASTRIGDDDDDELARRRGRREQEPREGMAGCRRPGRRRRGHDARGAGRDALPGAAGGRRGPDAGRWPARRCSRFAGMEPGRPVGGTYYLYRTLRNLDLDGVLDRLMEQAQQDVARAAHARSRSASSRTSTRPASTSSRRRSRPRSAGGSSPTGGSRPWPRPCASRCPRTSTSCTPAARRWPTCARPSTRSPASWPCAWPASAATAARARSTSAAPCATRSATAACRPSPSSATRGRPSPRSS